MSLYKKLKEEDIETLRNHYRNNDLFRHWSPILCDIERVYGESDAISLWKCSDECLSHLRSISQYRETEIDYLFRILLREGNETIAVTVMCIVLIRLMNAVEKEKENEFFDNEPMCIAIMRILNNHSYNQLYNQITNFFFGQKIGLDGKPVVFQPLDPMKHNLTMDDLSEEEHKEVEQLKSKIIEITNCLQIYWKTSYFNIWKKVWEDICLNPMLSNLVRKKNPTGAKNTWGINEKMICNVIGMFNNNLPKQVEVSKLSGCLKPEKDRRLYINTTTLKFAGTSSAFTGNEELYRSVLEIINNCLTEQCKELKDACPISE